MPDAIATEGLGKIYHLGLRRRAVAALDGITLRVEEGSIFGFVGPNGAGKSTTIKILVGLIAPTRGRAAVFGEPVPSPGSRLKVGYLPENPSFHEFLRPLEVLEFLGRMSGLAGTDLRRRAEAMLERVGLAGSRDLTVRKFSKGMVQRLGLAQALLHDPPLLVLDEPMSGLDPIGRKEVSGLISDMRRQGRTVFFSTHILNDVETLCDRVGMLLAGGLVAQGSLDSLLDGSIRAVELRCAGLPEGAFDGLRAAARDGIRGPDGWTFVFPDQDTAGAAAARVVGEGGRLLALTPQRETLEETFVRLASGGGRAR